MTGLARTLFMEDRAAYGTSVDLPLTADQLPSAGQLQALTQHGSEYAVALRGGRVLSLRLQPAAEPLPRRVPAPLEQTGFVSGGAKVRAPPLSNQPHITKNASVAAYSSIGRLKASDDPDILKDPLVIAGSRAGVCTAACDCGLPHTSCGIAVRCFAP